MGNMMISEDEWGAKVESGALISPYMDGVLKGDPSKYVQFVHRLYQGGMLRFTARPKDMMTPFCVAKKNGRLRLVLDCRAINERFREPPPMLLAVVPHGPKLRFQMVNTFMWPNLTSRITSIRSAFHLSFRISFVCRPSLRRP